MRRVVQAIFMLFKSRNRSDVPWRSEFYRFKKGAALSDKPARKEFGLTQEEIVEAIRGGKLQYRENNM